MHGVEKNKDINYEINELNIPGYTMYHNIQNKGERGVATYVSVEFYLYPTVGTVLIHSVKPELTE